MLIAAARIITADAGSGAHAILAPGYVTCADGRVVAVGAGPPHGRPDVHLHEGFLVPGFVDLQVNGYFGIELATADDEGWLTVARRLPETGTTAFLPTFITSPIDDMAAALRRAAERCHKSTSGTGRARTLGVHLEGPFISARRPGAHNPAWIVNPDPAAVETLIAAGSGVLRLVTIAPELDGGLAAIQKFAAADVLVSVGHSDATAQQVSLAAMNGATMVTHLFNAQSPMHHREPGVVGQALSDNRLTSSLIADLHHVSGQVAAIAFAAAPGRIFLITDAAACAGMPPGRYLLGGESIELAGGDGTPPVRSDGTLAGSALRMDSAVANMVATGIGLVEAVAAATRIPANLIGRHDLGRLATGAAADLVWLSDDLRTMATWVGGQQVCGPRFGLRRIWPVGPSIRTGYVVSVTKQQPVTHMRAEIMAQPAALRATIDELLPRTAEIAELAKRTNQVLFFARGTSDNAAVYGSYLIQTAAGRLASLGSPSVATTYHARVDLSGILAVGLSQSGRTHEIIETLAWARDCGAKLVAITNSANSPLADLADVALVTEAGIERAVPATKTFTCQLAALAVLSIGLGADLDITELRRLPEAIEKLLASAIAPGYGVDYIVDELADVDGLVVSARGLAYSAALELALKIKEACYLHAMGISYADLQHGPIAVVDAATPAIVMAADSGPTVDAAVGLAKRVTAAGAHAFTIGGGMALASAASKALVGPDLPEWLAPIGLIVPGQLLTESLSRRLGIDPDHPRGLSKITQTT